MILHPVSDIMAWVRLLAGVFTSLWLPGFWVLGRFLPGQWPVRAALSLMAGILMASGAAILTAHLDLPYTLLTILPALGLLGLGLGLWPAYRNTLARLGHDEPVLSRKQWLVVGLICGVLLLTVISIQGDFAVPPAVHDSGNHAFLTLRIMETGHTGAAYIFGPPYAQPQRPYFAGWHAAVALAATVSGLPPYVATWLFSLLTLGLLPVTLVLVWRQFGFPPPVVLLGAALLLVSGNILVEIPWRGGLGQFVGMFCLGLPFLAVVQSLRRGQPGLAAIGGLFLGWLVWVHGSWALITLILCVAAFIQGRQGLPSAGPRTWLGGGLALLALALVVLPDALPTAATYKQNAYVPQEILPPGESVLMLSRSVGNWLPLQVLSLLALVVGLVRRQTRTLAVVSAVFGLLAVSLSVYRDPVSLFVSQPWYQIYFRLYRPQVFFLLPLVAWVFLCAWQRLAVAGRGNFSRTVFISLSLGLVLPAWFFLDGGKLATKVLFADEDVIMATRIAEVVPEGTLVANWRNDGSCWAMQISRRHFLQGSNWVLGETEDKDYRFHVKELLAGRWTDRTRHLRDNKTDYIYATTHWMFKVPPVIQRDRLDEAPYFTAVLESRYATLYRVEWEQFR